MKAAYSSAEGCNTDQRVSRSLRSALVFLGHQFVSTLGTIVGTAFVVFTVTSVIHHWRPDIGNKTASLLLTAVPYFPLQAAASLLLGWWGMKKLGQLEILWVWILPALAMLFALVHGPVIEIGRQTSCTTISHFFGGGCRAKDGCFDQVLFTLPLYTAIAYSVGAAIARIGGVARGRRLGT